MKLRLALPETALSTACGSRRQRKASRFSYPLETVGPQGAIPHLRPRPLMAAPSTVYALLSIACAWAERSSTIPPTHHFTGRRRTLGVRNRQRSATSRRWFGTKAVLEACGRLGEARAPFTPSLPGKRARACLPMASVTFPTFHLLLRDTTVISFIRTVDSTWLAAPRRRHLRLRASWRWWCSTLEPDKATPTQCSIPWRQNKQRAEPQFFTIQRAATTASLE